MALALAALVCVAHPSVAVGEAPPPPPPPAACPAAPDDYTGTDQMLDELRDARRDDAAACAAIAERLAELVTSNEAIGASSGSTRVAVQRLAELAELDGPGLTVSSLSSGSPANSTVTLSDDDRQWWADSLTAIRADGWFLIGALVGLLTLGAGLIRFFTH